MYCIQFYSAGDRRCITTRRWQKIFHAIFPGRVTQFKCLATVVVVVLLFRCFPPFAYVCVCVCVKLNAQLSNLRLCFVVDDAVVSQPTI